MAGRRVVIGLALAAVLGGAALWSCGGDDRDRDEKVCDACHTGIDRGCLEECREFCLADDPACDTRCAAQCDQCRRDLVCRECRADCTGTLRRCAPTNETVVCEDGRFGGE